MHLIGILLILSLTICTYGKMVYMTQLFRHGARYANHDIYDGKDQKANRGQLIGMGMRQHYLLGRFLSKDYIKQLGLNKYFDDSQVQVFTDGTPRCVQSAYAHMAGWYDLGTGQEIPSGLDPQLLEPPFQQS